MREFKYSIGEKINGLIILESKRAMFGNKKLKAYSYKCSKCGYIGDIREDVLSKGASCPCCCIPPRIIVENINSLVAKEETKWMIPLFENGYDEAKLYSKGSTKKIKHICPYCGKQQTIARPIYQLYSNMPKCEFCGRGRSYPERLVTSLLNSLNIEFIAQLTSTTYKWCGNKRYDFYIPSLNMIIETHGEQHYKDTNRTKLNEVANNDKEKEVLALNNGIIYYIVLDCRHSDFDFIRQNIISSDLIKLLNSDIEWNVVRKMTNDTLTIQMWEYWNSLSEPISITKFAEKFEISRQVTKDVLQEGFAQNKLQFSMDDILNKNIKERNERAKGIANKAKVAIYKDGLLLGEFESMHELERRSEELYGTKLITSKISLVCDKDKKYKGFNFKKIARND